MSLIDKINGAKDRRDKAEAELREARLALEALIIERYRVEFGVTVGSRVRHTRKFTEGVVSYVDPAEWTGKPWVSAKMLKKNGEPSERETNLYSDWELIAP